MRLEKRVDQLENDFGEMRQKMTALGDDLTALRVTVKHVDDRTKKGELLMLDIQGEQRKMAKTLDRIAEHLFTPAPAKLAPPIVHAFDAPNEMDLDDDEALSG